MKKMFIMMVLVIGLIIGGGGYVFACNDCADHINKSFNNIDNSSKTIDVDVDVNGNQLGLLNQKGSGNQQGLINQKGSGINVVGGSGKYEGGDAQGQSQGQSMSFQQTFEDKRDHLEGPALLNSDAKFTNNKAFSAKTQGSVWDKVEGMSKKQADFINKTTDDDDVEIKQAALFEMKYRTKYIYKGVSGAYMGSLTVFPTGKDASTAGMEAQAALKAMKLGATHMVRVYVGSGELADGSSWNIGLGGGASIMRSGDDVAIAPNGGLGFGKASAFNSVVPDMVFELYLDENAINWEKSEYKGQTGNHTKYGSKKFNE